MSKRMLLISLIAITQCGCHFFQHPDGPPRFRHFWHRTHAVKPHKEARSRYGNPRSYVVRGKRYWPMRHAHHFVQTGYASWYGRKFNGKLTSNRERYNLWQMTAAHKTLPLPSYVRVTHLKTHKQIIVRVNDRGPFHKNRIIDLSYAAAKALGMLQGRHLCASKPLGYNVATLLQLAAFR